MSLAVQLLLTFVTLVAGTTIVLTVAAYRSSLESLAIDARRAVQVAAQMRDQTMTQLLTMRRDRAEGFLGSIETLCGEPRTDGTIGWSEECVRTMVQEYQMTEHATGVQLVYHGRLVSRSGGTTTQITHPGIVSAVVRRRDGRPEFMVTAARGFAMLYVQFESSEVRSLFQDRSGLGTGGEVFLIDASGSPVTELRFAQDPHFSPGVVAEPLADCRNGAGETIGYDYRGVATIHGFRPATALEGACIDAHISYAEAFAPGEALRSELILRGAAFVLMGALLSLIAAQRIAAPVRRLAESAHQIQGGRFSDPIPLGGPSEVRALGTALTTMAAEIEKLVRREQAARRDAEAANKSKDHFLATLSHELRTPLNAIFGWSRLLRTQSLDGERIERATLAIERSAESLKRLVEDLLDVSRIISGRLRLVRAPLRLDTVVEAALDAVRPQALDRGVRLETRVPGHDVVVVGDPQRLQQVVWNLLWNAIKFTATGGTVRLAVDVGEGEATIDVSDTGVGIAPESLPEIFGWFQQAAAGERSVDAGLGVGLALVKQIVDMHGGRVTAHSPGLGQGATFRVTLPLAEGSARLPAEERSRAAGRTQPPLTSVRVLLVEDDREWREAAQQLLKHAGAEVEAVASAAAARRVAAAWHPDVLVSDIAMPDEDGYSLMESLRRDGAVMPSIALTAFARREDAERARLAGFEVHMSKPVDPERLVDTIAALAGRNGEPR
jgi:signal transduction histidine kinase/CheY-like chemotaxis protein